LRYHLATLFILFFHRCYHTINIVLNFWCFNSKVLVICSLLP